MIENLEIGRSGYFYQRKRPLSNEAIDQLFRSLRAQTRHPSQNLFRIVRTRLGEARYSTICFSYERAPSGRASRSYSQVLSSIKAIGLIEAPVVLADPNNAEAWFLLDGHLRLEALKELGVAEVECLLATDDDTYTYNKRVNRIPPIQEHRMIVRAMERGVSATAVALPFEMNACTEKPIRFAPEKRYLSSGTMPQRDWAGLARIFKNRSSMQLPNTGTTSSQKIYNILKYIHFFRFTG